MEPINILDARNSLSRLVVAARAGEHVVIAKRGVPVARLVSFEEQQAPIHSAASAALWFTTHPVPLHATRAASELDEQISKEREGWE